MVSWCNSTDSLDCPGHIAIALACVAFPPDIGERKIPEFVHGPIRHLSRYEMRVCFGRVIFPSVGSSHHFIALRPTAMGALPPGLASSLGRLWPTGFQMNVWGVRMDQRMFKTFVDSRHPSKDGCEDQSSEPTNFDSSAPQ
jgi:hypothetical protein